MPVRPEVSSWSGVVATLFNIKYNISGFQHCTLSLGDVYNISAIIIATERITISLTGNYLRAQYCPSPPVTSIGVQSRSSVHSQLYHPLTIFPSLQSFNIYPTFHCWTGTVIRYNYESLPCYHFAVVGVSCIEPLTTAL